MKKTGRIRPEHDFAGQLLSVQKPGRYTGGEFGIVCKDEAFYRVCVSYPDLYEIGMSNQAIQIIYHDINTLGNDISCERVFAPAPDFEELLRQTDRPLYGLESGTPLADFDMIAFSMGYELTLTNFFAILDVSGIPVKRKERGADVPIILLGGPGVTNPEPLRDFVDAVFIGEWEGVCGKLVKDLAEMKRRGAGRNDQLERVGETPGMWLPEGGEPIIRQIYDGFQRHYYQGHIVPSIQTIQDHGVIEIMRGCPSGCRFCHAGMIYRPQRERDLDVLLREAEDLVHTCGYREITLSSLSTADYSRIGDLIGYLNSRYSGKGVSFALPSLRINTFTLDLLEEVSQVRKSGLTFAVETPVPEWQRRINKEAGMDRIADIMLAAKKRGWRHGKLYFMIGLPVTEGNEEAEHITAFCRDLGKMTRMNLNVHIGTFVPKPHTPFERSRQMIPDDSFRLLLGIKRELDGKNMKVRFHTPFVSFLEGVLSRGDHRAGELFYQAFLKGARLDSWEEHLDRRLWDEVLHNAPWEVEYETCRERGEDETLPWENIKTGVSDAYTRREFKKSLEGKVTGPCSRDCDHNCGVCDADRKVSIASRSEEESEKTENILHKEPTEYRRVLLQFSKKAASVYLSHINIMTVFERSLQRADLAVRFSEGFNPKPKMEFAHPLSLGVASECENLAMDIDRTVKLKDLPDLLNRALPEGIRILHALAVEEKERMPSLMKAYWGSLFRVEGIKNSETFIELLPDYMTPVREDEEGLIILVEDGTGKGPSLVKHLKKESEGYVITRLMQYAKDQKSEKGYSAFDRVFCSP